MRELEEVLSSWLVRSGFEVLRTSTPTGVEVRGKKNEEEWVITLHPHSPLASQVSVGYTVAGIPGHKLGSVWEYISLLPEAPAAEPQELNQAIPGSVLLQIRSSVCLKTNLEGKTFQASGFVVEEEGLIVCTAHNLKNSQEITVVLFDGREVPGQVKKIDFHRDLALIDINMKVTSSISLLQGRNLLGLGERLYSVGCPNNLVGTVQMGMINGPPRRVDGMPLWQAKMDIFPGSSGSPVFDMQGSLVAVVKGRFRGTEAMGFLIPMETLLDFIKEQAK
jgi:serine protease Do